MIVKTCKFLWGRHRKPSPLIPKRHSSSLWHDSRLEYNETVEAHFNMGIFSSPARLIYWSFTAAMTVNANHWVSHLRNLNCFFASFFFFFFLSSIFSLISICCFIPCSTKIIFQIWRLQFVIKLLLLGFFFSNCCIHKISLHGQACTYFCPIGSMNSFS